MVGDKEKPWAHQEINCFVRLIVKNRGDRAMATILIIEDDPEIRELYRRILERAGYQVLDAPDGDVGVRIFREKPVDLVLTDIVMPEKEGLETIMELKREFPSVRIIAMSGGGKATASFTCLHLAKMLGADQILTKPIPRTQLIEAVKAVLSI